MRSFLIACLLLVGVTSLFSQMVAPDPVLKGFIKNYSDTKAIWSVTDEGTYKADFKLINMPATAWFDSTGHRTNVVVEIKSDQLPAIALGYLDRNYPKAKIIKAQKWTDDKKVNTFEADIKLATETKKLLFSSRGDLIKELGKE